MATTGHESEAINVQDLKASLQKFKTDISDKKYVNKTWAQLKAMRDGGTLLPGQWYRITDYVTTTAAADTQSAGHQFDIIVRADDVNVLNENAYAAKHEGDTYFANSNLSAWKLKYCLDNIYWSLQKREQSYSIGNNSWSKAPSVRSDGYYLWSRAGEPYYTNSLENGAKVYYSRGSYVDSGYTLNVIEESNVEGTGTIILMKDEFNNECSYDFKNIMFARYQITSFEKVPNLVNTYSGIVISSSIKYPSDATISNTAVYRYTFDYLNRTTSNDITIYQLTQNNITCYNNKIASYYDNKIMRLNNIVVGGNSSTGLLANNIFNYNCINNTIGHSLFSNIIGNDFKNNIIGNNVYGNIIGNDFQYNSIGNSFQSNSIGNSFQSNSIDTSAHNNSIGNSFQSNSIGNSFQSNSIGNTVHHNAIGNNFRYSSIGNNVYNNIIGNYFQYSSIGNYCFYIKTGTSDTIKNYCSTIIIEPGNRYIYLNCSATTSSSAYFKNVKIAQGVNTTSTYKTITHPTAGDTFQTEYKPVNSQVISV